MKKIKFKICPQCKSKNITSFLGFRTGIQYECLDCGYFGPLIIEEEKKIRK